MISLMRTTMIHPSVQMRLYVPTSLCSPDRSTLETLRRLVAQGLHFVVNAKRYTEKTTRWTHDFATERHVVNTQLDEHFDRLENKLCEIETYQHMTHNMVDTTLKRLYDEYEALEQKAKHLLERQRPLRHALEQILAASDDPPEVARNSRDTDEWPYASTI